MELARTIVASVKEVSLEMTVKLTSAESALHVFSLQFCKEMEAVASQGSTTTLDTVVLEKTQSSNSTRTVIVASVSWTSVATAILKYQNSET